MAHEHSSKRTQDHKVIQKWIEDRGGRPSVVTSTWDGKSGLLRVDFGEKEASLQEISWEDFFRIFDESDLAFLYQEETTDGGESRFFKFVQADGTEDER